MKKSIVICAAGLASAAGVAVSAPPVVDGVLDSSGVYSVVRWRQNVPTGFGDNIPDTNCVESNIGTPLGATTGVEISIPLTTLGSPTGDIRVCAFLNSSGHNSALNQALGGLGVGAANLGNPRSVALNSIAGNQYGTVAAGAGAAPTVDGTLDASYGSAVAVQNSRTSAGDNTDTSGSFANGSELDAMYTRIAGGKLYIMITGNLNSDFTKFELFIDTGTGNGFNQLPQNGLPDVDFQALQQMNDDGSGNGLRFDTAFTADYYMTFGCGGSPVTYYPNFADLNAGTGSYLGNNQAGNGSGTLIDGTNPDGIEVALSNANIGGVLATCPPPKGDPDISRGSEIDNVYSYLDRDNGKLYVFIGGNLETNYNKFDLFFDVRSGGQNTMLFTNVDVDFNGLNHMGGLTFDTDFAADYWLSFTNGSGGTPVNVFSNAAVLRTDGPRPDSVYGLLADYGAYDGGSKDVFNPIPYNGPRIDAQTGSQTALFCNYGPRLAGDSCFVNPDNPVGVPGLVKITIDNSNIAGVTGTSADVCSTGSVATGFEMELDLNELGWDGESPIKLAGAIQNGGHDYMSNQVIGGLPDGSSNLGTTGSVNFANIAGVQYVNLSKCLADFDGDGFITGVDFDLFVGAFESGDPSADFDGDCFNTGVDYDLYVSAFEAGC